MKPPGRTTLARMQLTAFVEAERIEISQDARVAAGAKVPDARQVAIRDDLMGMVRMIDAIESDQNLKKAIADRLDQMRAIKMATQTAEAAKQETEVEAE
jgi:hypothetical protein